MGSSFMHWISALKEIFQKAVTSIHAFCHLSAICLLQSMQHHDAILKAEILYTDHTLNLVVPWTSKTMHNFEE